MSARDLLSLTLVLVSCIDDSASEHRSQGAARGEVLYRTGESARKTKLSAVIAGGVRVDGALPPCASCHGPDGEGGQEGGVLIPSLRWSELTAPYGRRHPLGGWRPPYDEETLARAIRSGVASSGDALDPLMPRFELQHDEMQDLLAHLQRLGSRGGDREPQGLRIGAVIPLTGPKASLGRARLAELESEIVKLNERGGVFGRKLELVPLDATSPGGDLHGLLALITDVPVEALDLASESLTKTLPVIAVGPLRDSMHSASDVFHLAPTPQQRGCAAARFVASDSAHTLGTVLVASPRDEQERALVAAFASELQRLGHRAEALPAADLLERSRALEVTTIVEVGDGHALASLPQTRAGVTKLLIATEATPLPSARVNVVQAAGRTQDAVAVVVAALKAAGRAPSRERLMRAVEQVAIGELDGRKLRFGRHRRLGATGVWVALNKERGSGHRWISAQGCGAAR